MKHRNGGSTAADLYYQRPTAWVLLAFAAVALAVRFASPILDSDLFWQMAYARQMIERGTLVLDHTAFSWTPTSNATIYCAWIAELALYGLWNAFGLPGLFALCYAAPLLIVGLLWRYAHRMGMTLSPMLVMVLLIVVLASGGVIQAKPELFSVVFTHGVLWAYFQAKRADRNGERSAVLYLALLPVTMLIWVNSHGGFILMAPVLTAMATGELINRRMSNGIAMSARCLRWLLAACGLCALATPYGVEYPWQLFNDYVWNASAKPDVAWNNAYRSMFSDDGWQPQATAALLLMLGTLGALCWRAWRRRASWRKRFDFAPLLLVIGTLPLYLLDLRSMHVFVAVFGYAAVWLVSPAQALATDRDPQSADAPEPTTGAPSKRKTRRRAHSHPFAQGLCALLVALAVAHTIVDRTTRPQDGQGWLGFGIGTLNPVDETEFLARSGFHGPIYNTFETGGYLLWKLNDSVKVMVDARSFPYLAWFDDHQQFVSGENFDAFLDKYPGPDVALIDYAKGPLLRNFVRSMQWRLVYIGPSAAIFVRQDSDAARKIRPEPAPGLATLRNAAGALAIFDFARFAGDYRAAWTVVDRLQSGLEVQGRNAEFSGPVAAAGDYRRAHQATRNGDHAQAFELLNRSLNRKVTSENEQTLLALLLALSRDKDVPLPDDVPRIETRLRSLIAPPDEHPRPLQDSRRLKPAAASESPARSDLPADSRSSARPAESARAPAPERREPRALERTP